MYFCEAKSKKNPQAGAECEKYSELVSKDENMMLDCALAII